MLPPLLAGLRASVSDRVLAALDEHTDSLREVGDPLADFLLPARDLLGGGKRLRAVLCGAGWLAAGGADDQAPAVVLAGSALELFQATALVHDDVMDGSLTRRGKPAAHRQYAAEHASAGWLGSPDSYGEAGAILLGDLLLALSSMEMERARAHVGATAGSRARATYDRMTAEVAVGQYLDIRLQDQPWQDGEAALAAALTVVRHKSARYSVEHPLVLGAALADGPDETLGSLAAVGLPLGEAFQLRDDELGVFGNPAETGKPAGDDLREGKRTALLALTVARVDAETVTRLRERVGRPDLAADEVQEIRDVMRESGAVAEHEALIASRRDAALEALDAARVSEPAREAVRELAEALTARSA